MPPTPRTLVALVENKSGVLNRVASLFRRRQFNIESLTVGHSEKKGLSRMTIVIEKDTDIDQAFRQMYKIIEVIKIKKLDESAAVIRDLALVKIRKSPALAKILRKFGARIAKKNGEFIVAEICAAPPRIDEFISAVRRFGILEISRTGATALSS